MRQIDQQLLEAAKKGDASACHDLLERGADVHMDDKSWGVLHWAAGRDDADTCQLLLERGADFNAVDNDGLGVLHCAAWKGCAQSCLLLLDCGSNVSLKDKNDQTAIDVAIAEKHEDCASAMRAWIAANAARTALQEISAANTLKAVAP